VLFQGDNYGFSAAVLARSRVAVLDKGVAKAGPASGAQPVSVANALAAASALGLAGEVRLAVTDDKLPELAIITLKEH